MKQLLIYVVLVSAISCNSLNKDKKTLGTSDQAELNDSISVKLILPNSLENRRLEFQNNVKSAQENIKAFSEKYGWKGLCKEEFMDSVLIFDNKGIFNKTLLKLAGADTSINLPETYCAALEKRTLVSVSPEFYSKVYPEGVEKRSFEKLLTHEIAHQLHVRILDGDEEAMGPIWFYEGFAIYAANQFSESSLVLSKKEMIDIMKDPDRGSYVKYNYIFRYFFKKVPLKDLLKKAKNENFNDELIKMIQ